jgi:hypothetical protein
MRLTNRVAALVLIAIVTTASPVLAFGQEHPNGSAPKLVTQSFTHDFGEVKPGEPLKYSFIIKNEGNANLQITSVAPSCGCTASEYDKIIAPGKEGKITLAVGVTDHYVGETTKSATVNTNDPARPTFNLILRAYFKPTTKPGGAEASKAPGMAPGKAAGPYTISPSDRWFTSALSGTTSATKITFYNRETAPVRITKVEAGGSDFNVSLTPIEDGKRYELFVSTNPALKPGQYKQDVKLTTDDKTTQEIKLHLEATVFAKVLASPSFISMPKLDMVSDIASINMPAIYIRKVRELGLNLKDVRSSLPFLKLEVKTEIEGQFYIIKLSLDPSKIEKPGDYKGEVIVDTNDAEVPQLKIPINISFSK